MPENSTIWSYELSSTGQPVHSTAMIPERLCDCTLLTFPHAADLYWSGHMRGTIPNSLADRCHQKSRAVNNHPQLSKAAGPGPGGERFSTGGGAVQSSPTLVRSGVMGRRPPPKDKPNWGWRLGALAVGADQSAGLQALWGTEEGKGFRW